MKPAPTKTTADYFGLTVEVIYLMNHCALIRFKGRELVVDAVDLRLLRSLKKAA